MPNSIDDATVSIYFLRYIVATAPSATHVCDFLILVLVLVISSIRQSSVNSQVFTYYDSNVMILSGLIQTVSLFQNIIAKPTFLCCH